MEGGRFLIAVVLMIAVVILTNLLLPPSRPVTPIASDSVTTAVPAERPTVEKPPTLTNPQPETVQPVEVVPAADTVFVVSPLYRYGISTSGGALVSAELTPYESYTRRGTPVQLVPEGSPGLFRNRLKVGEALLDLSTLPFRAEPTQDLSLVTGGATDSLRLTYTNAESGLGIELIYRFQPNDYLYDVRMRVTGAAAATPQLWIDMGSTLPFHEWNPQEDTRSLAYVVNNPNTGIESAPLSKVKEERLENGPLSWAALKNKYFVIAALQNEQTAMPFGGLIAKPAGEHAVQLTATLQPNADGVIAYRVYAGPQDPDHLDAIGNRFSDVNPVGWKFLRPVLQPLAHGITWLLLEMHRVLGLSYGWVLILFGVLVRVLLWPLNARAMRSQMKNMQLQPRMKEIQTKYRQDPERMNKEMLRLYKEEGFNPMGGCLPMLIPFPVLITLFFVFQATIEFRGVPFLWLPDLSRADPYYIVPVIMGISMFVLQWLSLKSTAEPTPQMKMMLWMMPGMMTVLFLNFASGLNLYYTAMNIASLPQQLLLTKERNRLTAAPAITPTGEEKPEKVAVRARKRPRP
jgi:YidC/Oxa1 family membrane protein insertase